MCCTDGSITFDWAIEKSGFVCGEDVWIRGSVQNDSRHTVACSTITFYMVSRSPTLRFCLNVSFRLRKFIRTLNPDLGATKFVLLRCLLIASLSLVLLNTRI